MARDAKRLIADFRGLKRLRYRLKLAQQRARRANLLVETLDQRIRDVAYIKEVYKGVPLEFFGGRVSSPCTGRQGEFWKNMHTRQHWGLEIIEPDTGLRRTLGLEWPTECGVLAALREWVACGVRPVLRTPPPAQD
jgi:hypothetical protein